MNKDQKKPSKVIHELEKKIEFPMKLELNKKTFEFPRKLKKKKMKIKSPRNFRNQEKMFKIPKRSELGFQSLDLIKEVNEPKENIESDNITTSTKFSEIPQEIKKKKTVKGSLSKFKSKYSIRIIRTHSKSNLFL